ncbi:hypothetical protein [Streptomyces sp. NPDC026673]|uniref:hypothetical protein n=1 Tax=Streptomyces sp. NPDC026673 TaxID=3155724 RepID=UPI0033C9EDE1
MFASVCGLLELPEAFVLCERIDSDPLWLAELWSSAVGEDTPLERLEEAWLYGTGDKERG